MSLTYAAYLAGFANKFSADHQKLEAELSHLITAAEITFREGNWWLLKPIWQVVSDTLWRLSDWTTYRQFDQKSLEIAHNAGDRQAESLILSELGWISLEEKEWEEADQYFQKAQFIVDDLTSTEHSVRLRRYRAILFRERGQLDNAAILLAEAEHLVKNTSDIVHWPKHSRERSLALISHAYAGLSRVATDYETALNNEQQAIARCSHPENLNYRPMFDLQLGDIYYLRGDLDQAGCIWQLIMRHGWRCQPEQRIIAAAFLRMAQLAACRDNRERALGWAYRAEQLYQTSGLAEKARQAAVLANNLDHLLTQPPPTWPTFELWD
jgi:tetratricopeptide (TPR) repeat protein